MAAEVNGRRVRRTQAERTAAMRTSPPVTASCSGTHGETGGSGSSHRMLPPVTLSSASCSVAFATFGRVPRRRRA